MWQASKNILPTKYNLCHRKVLIDPVCEACGMGAESSGYLFWGCNRACVLWNLTGISYDAHKLAFPKFVDFLWHLIFGIRLGQELLELVVMVAWCMWFNRNEAWLGKTTQ